MIGDGGSAPRQDNQVQLIVCAFGASSIKTERGRMQSICNHLTGDIKQRGQTEICPSSCWFCLLFISLLLLTLFIANLHCFFQSVVFQEDFHKLFFTPCVTHSFQQDLQSVDTSEFVKYVAILPRDSLVVSLMLFHVNNVSRTAVFFFQMRGLNTPRADSYIPSVLEYRKRH